MPHRPHPHRTAWGAVVALLLVASVTRAEPYSVPILIDTNQDIIDLADDDLITSDERDRLLTLYDDPVSLNSAGRDELYALPNATYSMIDGILQARRELGGFTSISQLRLVKALPEDVYFQIIPFVEIRSSGLSRDAPEVTSKSEEFKVSGQADLGLADIDNDGQDPTFYIRAENSFSDWFTIGWVGFAEAAPGNLTFRGRESGDSDDNESDSEIVPAYFIADRPSVRFDPLRKLYAASSIEFSDGMTLEMVGGSYVAGFGERLTFDSTNRGVRPDGLYLDAVIQTRPQDGTFTTRNGQFGGAVRLEKIRLSEDVTAHFTAMGSYTRNRLFINDFNLQVIDGEEIDYQGVRVFTSQESADLGTRVDVLLENGEIDEQGCRTAGTCLADTFYNVYDELLVGGNFGFRFGDRSSLGFTGFFAQNEFLSGAGQVVFAPSATNPIRDDYWVVGTDGSFGVGPFDIFAEVAMTDVGGIGAVARALVDFSDPRIFVQLIGRYYDERFDNPKSRAYADADEFFGNRGRDEGGAQLLVQYEPLSWLDFQAWVDVWQRFSLETTNAEFNFRTNFTLTKGIRYSTWINLKDKDVSTGGRSETFDAGSQGDFLDESELFVDLVDLDNLEDLELANPGRGMAISHFGQFSVNSQAIPRTTIVARYRVRFEDIQNSEYTNKFEPSYLVSLRGSVRVIDELRLTARVSYEDEDWLDERGEQELLVYGQIDYNPWKFLGFRFRYDFIGDLRDREPEERTCVTNAAGTTRCTGDDSHSLQAIVKGRW